MHPLPVRPRRALLVLAALIAVLTPGSALPRAQTAQLSATADALVGRLRIDRDAFVDDRGPIQPIYAHAGNLFWLFIDDPGRALGELDNVARAGFLGGLGCDPTVPCRDVTGAHRSLFWDGRELGPDRTDDSFTAPRPLLT